MLNYEGWINGISATFLIIFGSLSGIYFISISRKIKNKLLSKTGTMLFFGSLAWLGNLLDFITINLTQENFDNSSGLIGILSFIWFFPMGLSAVLFGSKILIPEKRWYLISTFLILGFIFELLIIFDTNNAIIFNVPTIAGENLIEYRLNTFSTAGLIQFFFGIVFLIGFGLGFLYKSKISTGTLRTHYLLLGLGFFTAILCAILDDLLSYGIFLVFIRIGFLLGFWLLYFGLTLEKNN